MSLKDELLQKLKEKDSGFMLAELYGIFDAVELLDEVIKLEKEGLIIKINNNRIMLAK